MAGGFYKSYNVQVNNTISQTGTTPAIDLSLLLTSRRGNQNASPALTLTEMDVDLYQPYLVPSQYTANGSTALAWAKSIGATVSTGISGTITLVSPDTVTPVQGGTYVNLTWDAEPFGWSSFQGGGVTGSLTQAVSTATGSIYSVSASGYTMTLSSPTGTFDTTNVLSVAYVNTSSPLPNGLLTEEWVLNLYYACEALNLQNTLNLKFARPSISLSLVSDRDSNYTANPASLNIGTPTSVTTAGLPAGQVLLAWSVAPSNWHYVPKVAFGTTLVSQSAGAIFGTILQQLGPTYTASGTGVSLLLENVTGTFTAAATVMALDSTVSTFNLLGNNYYKFVACGYPIVTDNDLNVDNIDFKDYIISVNTQQATSVDQFGTIGVFANSSTPSNNYQGTVAPNSVNFQYGFYYYPNLIQDSYISAPQVAASLAAAQACNSLPFNTMFGVSLNGLPVSSNAQTYVTVGIGKIAEALLQYGATPIAVNQSTGVAYIAMPVSTQTNINGVTDAEFYDIRTQQVRTEINARLDAAMKAPPFQNAQINDLLEEQAETAIYAALVNAEADDLIFNVVNWKSSIVVTRSKENAHQLNISCVIQIAPSLTSVLINVNVISSLITPPSTQV